MLLTRSPPKYYSGVLRSGRSIDYYPTPTWCVTHVQLLHDHATAPVGVRSHLNEKHSTRAGIHKAVGLGIFPLDNLDLSEGTTSG